MDRTTAANHITVDGKRKHTETPPATTITAEFLNSLQEEVMACIEGAGITPDSNTLTQLRDSIFATILGGGFFNVPAIGLSIGGGGEGAWVSGGNSTMEGEHHFTDFTLQSAHQLSVGSTGILIIRCTGTATINGSINGNGDVPGATGSGGIGAGGGGGGGTVASNGGAGGGVWSAGASGASGVSGGSGKINPLLIRLHAGILGGSGGIGSGGGVAGSGVAGSGGGTFNFIASEWTVCNLLSFGIFLMGGGGGGGGGGSAGGGGGGGAGGNFILIVAEEITGSGVISASGSNGGGGGGGGAGGGGGGGGGSIFVVSKNNPSTLVISAIGGVGGAGAGGGVSGNNGTNGFAKKYYPGA